MGETALTIIEDQIESAQTTIITLAVDELVDNLATLPIPGTGLRVMEQPIRGAIEREIDQKIEPELRAHTDAHLAYIEAAASGEGAAAALPAHEEELMETNPLWTMLEGDEEITSAVREELLQHSRESAAIFAGWVEEADGREFNDFVELAQFLGTGGEEMADILGDLLYYIDLLGRYRDHLNPGVYHRVLARDRVKEWFLDQLITGLEDGRAAVTDHIVTAIENPERS
ncbi:MAG: hypothetical protein SVW02_03380 [Candidatus Nanohaloarchaea archaeon]|nr:hypothetical protein [Candidatus Nanohaloarchaea archaeon]